MTTELKDNARPQLSTAQGQASKEVPYDDKNLSEKPFQHPEACYKQGLPVLWPISDAVLRAPDSGQAAGNTRPGLCKMSQKDREFFYSVILQYRVEAKACLYFLSRYDDGISIEDSHALCNAINAIDRAVIEA